MTYECLRVHRCCVREKSSHSVNGCVASHDDPFHVQMNVALDDDDEERDERRPRSTMPVRSTSVFDDVTAASGLFADACSPRDGLRYEVTVDDGAVEPMARVYGNQLQRCWDVIHEEDDDQVTAAAAAVADDDVIDMYMDDGECSRPDRPDCVPKIDLSWIVEDERRNLARHRTVEPPSPDQARRRNQPRHHLRHHDDADARTTDAAAQHLRGDHVTQDGGQAEVVGKRPRRITRRRRAKHRTKRHRTRRVAVVVRPSYTSPITPRAPRTPRRQIVRQVDTSDMENKAEKLQEVELNRMQSAQADDDGGCVSGSENEFSCMTTTTTTTTTSKPCDVTRSLDVISVHDVSVSNVSDVGMMQYGADTTLINDAETFQTNANVNAEGFQYEAASPRNVIPESSDAGETRHDGGDAVCADRKLECESESSLSLAERLLCALDCCNCCRLTLSLYRSAPQQ